MDIAELRKKVLERDQYTCKLCGKEGIRTAYIISPLVGGLQSEDNLITVCDTCEISNGLVYINIPINARVYDRLQKFCQKVGRSESDIIRQIISEIVWQKSFQAVKYNGEDKRIKIKLNASIYEMMSKIRKECNIKDIISFKLEDYMNRFLFKER